MPHAIVRSIWARSSREHLGRIGVLPEVAGVAREPTFAGQQRGRVRDRAPAVRLVLGVEREVDADVVGRAARCRLRGGPTAPAP